MRNKAEDKYKKMLKKLTERYDLDNLQYFEMIDEIPDEEIKDEKVPFPYDGESVGFKSWCPNQSGFDITCCLLLIERYFPKVNGLLQWHFT